MQKKFLSLLLSCILICSFGISAAAKVYITDIKTPEAVFLSETDGVFNFDVDTFNAADFETARLTLYNGLKETYSDKELTDTGFAYLLQKITLLAEISADGENWFTAKSTDINGGKLSISLWDEALPCLKSCGVDMTEIWDGFTLYIRFLICNENYSFSKQTDYFVKSETSKTFSFDVPRFGYAEYVLPDGVFVKENPEFFAYPLSQTVYLTSPHRNGYTFDGWVDGNLNNTNCISPDTRYICLTAKWLTKTYEVNYVLTTHPDYNFSGVNNTMNPKSYTPDNAEKISDPVCPVDGFNFEGWFDNPEFEGEKINEIPLNSYGDKVFYALWLTDEEKVLYDIKKAFWGDLDSDLKVSAADARIALRNAVGLDILTPDIIKRADFGSKGYLSSADARTLLRIAVELDSLPEILKQNNLI